MAEHSMAYVAFDTSKLHNAVALAEAGRAGEVRYLGELENTPAATAKLVRKLTAKHGALTFCYEAGPTGYGLHRQIRQLGQDCIVVAPSLIPRKPGKRVKTNRLDALSLVKQLRAGELTAVWVPDERHEAVRELTRARGAAAFELRAKCQQVSSMLLRLGRHYPGQDDLGQGAHGLARRAEAGASRATHCVGGAAGCGAPGEGAHRTTGAGDRRGGAGLVAGAAGNGADGVTRGRLHRGDDAAGRDRRSEPLPHAARADGLARSGAERVLHRRGHQTRPDHQGGQPAGTAAPDRMRLELSASATGRRRQAGQGCRRAAGGARHCVEGAGAADRALSCALPRRQAGRGRRHRSGARAGGLHLGHRACGCRRHHGGRCRCHGNGCRQRSRHIVT